MMQPSETLLPIRKMKQSRAPLIGILMAFLIVLSAIVWAASGKGGRQGIAGMPLSTDFQTVWTWSEPEFVGGGLGARWTFRWDGKVNLKAARTLASGLGFKLSSQISGNDGPVDVVATDPAYKMTLWIHSQAGEDAAEMPQLLDCVLLLDAAAHTKRETILSAITKVERQIQRSAIDLHGSFTVKGNSVREGAGARLANIAGAKEAEAYEDGHTSSLTYFSRMLGSKVESGSQPVNLQIAETLPGVGKTQELIIGVPLITGDYSFQNE